MGFLMKYDQPQKSYRDRERTQNALILSVTSSCRRRGLALIIHYFKITVKTSDFLSSLTGTNNRNDNQNNDKIDKQKVRIEIPDTTFVCSTPLAGNNNRNNDQNNDKIDKKKVKIEIPDTTSVCSTPLAGTSDTRISTKRGGGLFTK